MSGSSYDGGTTEKGTGNAGHARAHPIDTSTVEPKGLSPMWETITYAVGIPGYVRSARFHSTLHSAIWAERKAEEQSPDADAVVYDRNGRIAHDEQPRRGGRPVTTYRS
jgi:hypothetical protein